MLTKNGVNFIASMAIYTALPLRSSTGSEITWARRYYIDLGYNYYILYPLLHARVGAFVANNSYVYFGTGSTPATINDYAMESIISNSLSVINPSGIACGADSNGAYATATYTLTNTGSSSLSVSEIGTFPQVPTEGGSSTYPQAFMLDHTVFETPIVLAPGESKTIEYTIRFNYPTA